jgi:hypothetical protein
MFPVLSATMLSVCSIISLVGPILVMVKMFQHNETGFGIASIMLSFCTGIGVLLPFIYGWMKADAWDLRRVMLVRTVCFVLSGVFYGVYFSTAGIVIQLP